MVPAEQLGSRRLIIRRKVVEQEALNARTRNQCSPQVAQTDVGLIEAVRQGDRADDHHPSEGVEVQHRCVVDGPRRVVDEDIDSFRAGLGNVCHEVGRATMVDRLKIAQFPAPVGLGIRTDNGDRLEPLDTGDLSRHLPDSARSCRDENRLPGFGGAGVEQCEVGREAGHPEVAQAGLDRRILPGHAPGRGRRYHRVRLPAEIIAHH